MAQAAKEAMGKKKLKALADRGYFNGLQIKACEDDNIAAFVPKPMTSNAKAEGRFDKTDFVYIAKQDAYRCPAGEQAIYRFSGIEKGLNIHVYWPSACHQCALKSQCTTSSFRRIRRWEHEDVLDGLDALPDEDHCACGHGDELACAGLQHEAGDQYPGNGEDDEGYEAGGGMSPYRPL